MTTKVDKTEQATEWAIAFARSILAVDAPLEIKRGFIKNCIWMVTEANGKYNLQYWSDGVYNLVHEQYGGDIKAVPKKLLRHEHVNRIKSLVTKIMDDHSCLETVLREQAIACLVKSDEHGRLGHSGDGFDRYKAAGIRVWDDRNQCWKADS